MSPAGFEPTLPATEWPQTYSLDSAAAGNGRKYPMGRKQVDETSSGSSLNGATSAMSKPSVLILQQLVTTAITSDQNLCFSHTTGLAVATPNTICFAGV